MKASTAAILLLFCAFTGAAGAAEKAADEADADLIEAPEITASIREASGWYARVDAGYNAFMDAGNPEYRQFGTATGMYEPHAFNEARFDANFSIGAGIGYQFNDSFRADVTADYFRTKFNAKAYSGTACTGSSGGATGTCTFENQRMNSVSTLANAYVDLGTYLGVTPYIGAGAGVAHVNWSGANDNHSCGAGSCAGVDFNGSQGEGTQSWRFAYAAMAGFSYDISDRLKLDVGYRYARIARGRMLDFSEVETSQGAVGAKGKDKGFSRHEIRMGLRLLSW